MSTIRYIACCKFFPEHLNIKKVRRHVANHPGIGSFFSSATSGTGRMKSRSREENSNGWKDPLSPAAHFDVLDLGAVSPEAVTGPRT